MLLMKAVGKKKETTHILKRTITAHDQYIWSVCFDESGKHVLTSGYLDSLFNVHDVLTGLLVVFGLVGCFRTLFLSFLSFFLSLFLSFFISLFLSFFLCLFVWFGVCFFLSSHTLRRHYLLVQAAQGR